MLKPLTLTDEQRTGCRVVFNVNRFEVFTADGMFLTAAMDKPDLKAQLTQSGIANPKFDALASCKYLQAA